MNTLDLCRIPSMIRFATRLSLLSLVAFTLQLAFAASSHAADRKAASFAPLLGEPGSVACKSDFSSGKFDKTAWQARQGTRWTEEDGVLRGIPSTQEFQDAHKDHKGLEPRVACLQTPKQFVADFKVRFLDGKETAIAPFVEFGHHIVRLKFGSGGLTLLADHESQILAESKEMHYEPGKTYHLIAELVGDEFVVQIEGGPTLYGKHPSLAAPATAGADGLGVCGPQGGTVELDDVTIWSVETTQPNWEATRAKLPKSEPRPVKKGVRP